MERLNKDDERLKKHELRLANQDHIPAKTSKILENLNNKHQEHMGITRVVHGFVTASYFIWYRDEKAAKRLEDENMREFYEGVRLLRKKEVQPLRGETRTPVSRSSDGAITDRRPHKSQTARNGG